jgi:hypothetical protein
MPYIVPIANNPVFRVLVSQSFHHIFVVQRFSAIILLYLSHFLHGLCSVSIFIISARLVDASQIFSPEVDETKLAAKGTERQLCLPGDFLIVT